MADSVLIILSEGQVAVLDDLVVHGCATDQGSALNHAIMAASVLTCEPTSPPGTGHG